MTADQHVVSNNPIVKELIERGIIHPRCSKWRLIMDAGDVARIVSEIFITEEEFRVVVDMLATNPEAFQKTEMVRSEERGPDSETLDTTPLGSDWRTKTVRQEIHE